MEEAIKQIKEQIASEENTDVRIGLRIALLLVQKQYINQLNQEINNHIKQN